MVHPKSEIFCYCYFDINRLLLIAFFKVIALQEIAINMGSNTKKKP